MNVFPDRRRILEGDDLHERVQQFLQRVLTEVIEEHTAEGSSDDWDLDALWTEITRWAIEPRRLHRAYTVDYLADLIRTPVIRPVPHRHAASA